MEYKCANHSLDDSKATKDALSYYCRYQNKKLLLWEAVSKKYFFEFIFQQQYLLLNIQDLILQCLQWKFLLDKLLRMLRY